MPRNVALTALVIVVPEAEPVVAQHRLRLDPSAALGVPAHVTVLFPFVPAHELDDGILGRVASVAGAVPVFPFRFSRTAWFDEHVVWLAPTTPVPSASSPSACTRSSRRSRRSRGCSTKSSRTSPWDRTSRWLS